MSCLDLVLPGSLTNANGLPFAESDQMITAGTLALLEPAHPVLPYSGDLGTPVAGLGAPNKIRIRNLPNVAARSARALTGASADADVALRFIRNDGLQSDGSAAPGGVTADGIVERSTKGGVHIIASQSTQQSGIYYSLELPTSINTYIISNPTHDYYLSLWYRVTRVALTPITGPYAHIGSLSGAGNNIFSEGFAGHLGSGALSASAITPGKNTVGNTIEQFANSFDGAVPAIGSMLGMLFCVGGVRANQYGDYMRNKGFSTVIYRAYLEDLTVSSRSFAQVKATDDAMYAEAFGAGGRYAGDTFTNPATIP